MSSIDPIFGTYLDSGSYLDINRVRRNVSAETQRKPLKVASLNQPIHHSLHSLLLEEGTLNLVRYFQSEPSISISTKELAVLDVVRTFSPRGASCADLQEEILKETGKEPRIATLYSLLADLERKGLIQPFQVVQHEKGGRPRQVFRITDTGRRAVSLGEAMVQSQAHLAPA